MSTAKDEALAQVALASEQFHAASLIQKSNDRNAQGVSQADARKPAQTAIALAEAAARRAGAAPEEIRKYRDS